MGSTVRLGWRVEGGRKRGEGEEAPLALRAARAHTVGYIEVYDQEQGVIESPCRQTLHPKYCTRSNLECFHDFRKLISDRSPAAKQLRGREYKFTETR